MTRLPRLVILSIAALSLAACASDYGGGYPSLARRPAERMTGNAEVAPATSAAPSADPVPAADLVARLQQLTAKAQAAHGQFIAHRARTETLVRAAGGAEPGSESWSVASVALADLESSRSQAMIALADLDALFVADRIAHPEGTSGDAVAIATARDQVIALVGEEDAALASLRSGVRG